MDIKEWLTKRYTILNMPDLWNRWYAYIHYKDDCTTDKNRTTPFDQTSFSSVYIYLDRMKEKIVERN